MPIYFGCCVGQVARIVVLVKIVQKKQAVFHLKKMRSSSIFQKLRSSSIIKKSRSSLIFKKWAFLPSSKKLRSSYIFHLYGLKKCCIPKISSVGCLEQSWVFPPFIKNWGRLPFSKLFRSSILHLVGSK